NSARSVASAVNAVSDTTGVRAAAQTTALLQFAANGDYAFELESGNSGSSSPVAFTVNQGVAGLNQAVSAFNDQAGRTGVVAREDAVHGGVRLVNGAGETIALNWKSGVTQPTLGAISASGALNSTDMNTDTPYGVDGEVTLDSAAAFSVLAESVPTGATVPTGSSQLTPLAALDISTPEGARSALSVIDSALTAVNGERTNYGAMQARFSGVISGLSVSPESTAGVAGRIETTDSAREVVGQSRTLIAQQGERAMQAQANQVPQSVLSLLR
ncbi:MAG: flagellin, partial [Burkholderiaceae bacterium]|nr:flagellin [Burkholderiaceae bacterium]